MKLISFKRIKEDFENEMINKLKNLYPRNIFHRRSTNINVTSEKGILFFETFKYQKHKILFNDRTKIIRAFLFYFPDNDKGYKIKANIEFL